jgi:hypothetical protein
MLSVLSPIVNLAAGPGPKTPLWRLAFDAIERPLAAAAEDWVQSEMFMDAAAVGFKMQRRVSSEAQRAVERWFDLWGLPTRRDLSGLANHVGSLERQLRELAAEVRRRERGQDDRGRAEVRAQDDGADARAEQPAALACR